MIAQCALFDLEEYTPEPEPLTLLDRIEYAPEDMQAYCYVGSPYYKTVGLHVGNIMLEPWEELYEEYGSYMCVLKFADGSLHGYHPFSLFPVLKEEDQRMTKKHALISGSCLCCRPSMPD